MKLGTSKDYKEEARKSTAIPIKDRKDIEDRFVKGIYSKLI